MTGGLRSIFRCLLAVQLWPDWAAPTDVDSTLPASCCLQFASSCLCVTQETARAQEAAAEAGAQAQRDMAHQPGEVSADAALLLRRRRAGLARISSRDSIGTTDTDCDNERWAECVQY